MSSRKSTKSPLNVDRQRQPLHVMGVDIGYGVTKIVTSDQTVMFPSVIAQPHHIDYAADEISARYPGQDLTINGVHWWTGDMALKQGKQPMQLKGRTADDDKTGMEFRVRLLASAIATVFPFQDGEMHRLHIATGLPVKHMSDAAMMKEMFISQLAIAANNCNLIAAIEACNVVPQPYGSIYSETMNRDGSTNEYYTARKTVTVDIGRYTVDVAYDNEGEYIDSLSGTAPVGMAVAEERIQKILESDLRTDKVPYDVIEKALRTGFVNVRGELVSYADDVNDAIRPVKDGTLTLLNNLVGNAFDVDVIKVSGGGAEAKTVYKEIHAAYPNAKLIADPQTANARGYYNYAMSRIAQSK